MSPSINQCVFIVLLLLLCCCYCVVVVVVLCCCFSLTMLSLVFLVFDGKTLYSSGHGAGVSVFLLFFAVVIAMLLLILFLMLFLSADDSLSCYFLLFCRI